MSRGKYDAAVAGAARDRAEFSRKNAESERRSKALGAELTRLERTLAESESRCRKTIEGLELEAATAFGCTKALDEATVMNAGMRAELERLGKNVDQLLSARGALSASLEQARARLEELRRAEAAAAKRAALFREVALRLKRMTDAGELQILLRSGRMVLVLPNDVLFDSGRTEINARGREALARIGAVLTSLGDRKFQVAGHTDNEPIRFSGFASNWELSSERALKVVAFLLKSGMQPGSLSAAGYGEFDPVRPNDSAEQRAANRRIEITLQPNIDEFVAVPEVK